MIKWVVRFRSVVKSIVWVNELTLNTVLIQSSSQNPHLPTAAVRYGQPASTMKYILKITGETAEVLENIFFANLYNSILMFSLVINSEHHLWMQCANTLFILYLI